MLSLPLFRRASPVLEGRRVVLRLPRMSDHDDWVRLRRESERFLKPWEPRWSHDEFTRAAWRERVRRQRRECRAGTGLAFLIFASGGHGLVGGITLGNIRMGVSRSGQIGYWMGERYAGRGYMHDAILALLDHAFATVHLHRVEAACIPGNERSVRVLEKAGFSREGILRSYLRINGSWEDHVLYALIDEDFRAKRRG